MKDIYEEKCKKIYRPRPSYDRRRRNYAIATCILLVLVAVYAFLFMFLIDHGRFDLSVFSGRSILQLFESKEVHDDFPLDCLVWNQTSTCPKNYPTSHKNIDGTSVKTCPEYFRWIHEDLRHWRDTGITRDMVEAAKKSANFRLVIVEGKAYVENFRKSFQTRDLFTLWGFQQLLRRYPGRVPDLELMFNCDDRPVFNIKQYFRGPNPMPPPLFKYCSDPWSLDIVIPDWSFWGWPETNQKPWEITLKDIKEGNKRVKWKERIPYAYWKGNPTVSPTRADLLKCNINHISHLDWDTRLFIQDWKKETVQGYKQSNVQDQCTYRYKIYVEGSAWSVSEKYILACDSPTLYITPRYYSFFARGLEPLKHFWPIRDTNKCKSLKFAVEWGNNHTSKAQEMGEESSRFTQDDINMDNVYDYMLHLLTEYAKLLRFKPSIPANTMEQCSESMACFSNGKQRKFMEDSLVRYPAKTIPCTLPPPYDPSTIKGIIDNRTRAIRQVEMWEDEYWKNQPVV